MWQRHSATTLWVRLICIYLHMLVYGPNFSHGSVIINVHVLREHEHDVTFDTERPHIR